VYQCWRGYYEHKNLTMSTMSKRCWFWGSSFGFQSKLRSRWRFLKHILFSNVVFARKTIA
jgi:hypothetical protein